MEYCTGVERNCAQCGKQFLMTTQEWAYKKNTKYFCSWTCMRTFEKQHPDKKQAKRIFMKEWE